MSEWKEIALKEIALKDRNSFIDGDWIESPYITENGIRLIQTGNIGRGTFRDNNKKYISEHTFTHLRCKEVKTNDILICRLADPIGRSCKVPFLNTKNITSVDVTIFRVDNNKFDDDFILHLLNTDEFLIKANEVSGGSTRQRISRSKLGELKLKVPDNKRLQRKIAEILTTCDTVIEQTQAAIEKYKAIKQGMLHDLFTRGLTANGQLRPTPQQAPELYKQSEFGLIPKEWEVKRLEEISTMKSGDGITSENISDAGDYPVFGGNGLRGFTSIYTHEGDNVLIGRQGAMCGNITRVSNKFFASEHAVVVTHNQDVDVDWLAQMLESMNLNQYSEASAQPGLAVTKILRLFIVKPQYSEQKEIGIRLISIDTKLQSEEVLLSKYQSIKKGLMSDLLSGKIPLTPKGE